MGTRYHAAAVMLATRRRAAEDTRKLAAEVASKPDTAEWQHVRETMRRSAMLAEEQDKAFMSMLDATAKTLGIEFTKDATFDDRVLVVAAALDEMHPVEGQD